jgi:uncharacterized protein (TIGR03086 family)
MADQASESIMEQLAALHPHNNTFPAEVLLELAAEAIAGQTGMVPDVDDVTLLSSVMGKTSDLMEGVRAEQWPDPTPCPDMTVEHLMEHMAGWVRVFEDAANGRTFDGDPTAYELTDDTAGEFRRSADELVAGWRSGGVDRTVRMTGPELPAAMVFNMTVMEYLTHGWDLATATRQPVPYTDDEAEDTLSRARATLPAEYRGPDKAFGPIVDVPEAAPPLVRLIGFMGRSPD